MDAKTVERSARYQPRLEDDPLVRGLGRYAADAPMAGQAQAYFVRSPHAFADIRSIDTAAAKAVPGVLAVLTAADMEGIGNVSQHPPLAGRGGQKLIVPPSPGARRQDRAACGRGGRGGDRGDADRRAGRRRARQRSITRSARRRSTCARPCARARRKSGRRLPAISRWTGRAWRRTPTPMPRRSSASSRPPSTSRGSASCINGSWCSRWSRAARPQATMPRTTATSCAAARKARARCATGLRRSSVFPTQRLRVVTEDVGGAFGLKTGPYPEYLAILVAARKIGRPVHWMSNRAEAFLSDNHARDAYSDVELALDERGKFSGAAHPPPRQHGRLYRRRRRQYPDRQSHALPARHVRHPADRHRHALRVHQHDADRALPRRRPSGGELHARARHRRSGARHRHRSGQAAPAQSHQAVGDAVQDRGRHHHRQRRVRGRARQGAGARRLRRLQAAPARSRQARQISRASASPACSSMPAAFRSKAPR